MLTSVSGVINGGNGGGAVGGRGMGAPLVWNCLIKGNDGNSEIIEETRRLIPGKPRAKTSRDGATDSTKKGNPLSL